MDSFEFNKISAAVLIGILLFMFVNISSESLYHAKEPETKAYVVELPEADASAASGEAAPAGPSLAVLLAAGDATKGERVFKKCQTCHTVEAGGANKTGPNLHNVVGGTVGSKDGFSYSDALAGYGSAWTYELLDAYLERPSRAIPGNKMSFAGLRRDTERADVIAYLRTFTENPPALPAVEEVTPTDEPAEEMDQQ